MKISFKYIFVFILFTSFAFAQRNNDDKLALQFYENKEYEKANIYFEKLFSNVPDAWYTYYYNSLLAVKDYGKAEKICKRQIKRSPQNASFYVHLGKVYKLQGENKKEKESYEEAIKKVIPIQNYLQQLAVAFVEEKLFDYAIETYMKGRKATPEYPYFYEIAEVYKYKNDIKAMINEYLDAIEFRDSELYTAQSYLQSSLGYDDDNGGFKNPLLKQELSKRIQQSPDKVVFSEFLIFLQKQQKDFDGAFVQSKALDKRLKEDGKRLFDLAKICSDNERYDVAEKCYQYVIDKGPQYGYYDVASVDIINCEYDWLTLKPQPSTEELVVLENKYLKAVQKYKESNLANFLIRNLANLQTYYLDKAEQAVAEIESLLENPALDPLTRAQFKIQLGDIYLIQNYIWDASLLYSQVEKDFKFEPIGQEAKFRNTKLTYYAGDFAWAKSQADVLKGSTSKLMANDALDLSLIITDAIGVDTNAAPLTWFAAADLMVQQHKYTQAINHLDSINKLFPEHTLGDDIYNKKAEIYTKLQRFEDAEKMYLSILEYYPNELYGDDAQFKLGELYEKKLNNPEKAKQAYEDVLTKYPGSIYVVEARKRFRALRGDNLKNG